MTSPFYKSPPPYTLPSNIIYFHDWRYVASADFAWQTPGGEGRSIWGESSPLLRYETFDMPIGVELVVKKPAKHGPMIPAPEQGVLLTGGSLIHDEGVYRLWYECWPGEQYGTPLMGMRNYVYYAESDDCVTWRHPTLGLHERLGRRNNSIVIGDSVYGEVGHHGGCVFKDPSAEPDARYKAYFFGHLSQAMAEAYDRERPGENEPMSRLHHAALFGATSPDGLHWRLIPKPLVGHLSDTHNACEYDPVRKKYVAYCRSWFFNKRTIGRMESDSFERFPMPDELIWPDATQKPCDSWYANGKTVMPGTTDYHVMFPLRWSQTDDRFEFHLATSPDNKTWGFVPGGPVCEPGPAGGYDAGVVWAGLGLVNLPGDRTGLLFQASPVPHKHPRQPPLGVLALATWPRGRLTALRAVEQGKFRTHSIKFRGRVAHLNYCTAPGGWIRVEAIQENKTPIPGRTFADCDPLCGDSTSAPITWKGQSDLAHADGQAIILRFQLQRAELYSVEFR